MIKFGSGGNPIAFYNEGHKSTYEIMKWLEDKNLNAYEYQCGRGVNISKDSAVKIGDYAKKHNISLSLHAPYFINLAGMDTLKLEKSKMHINRSIEAALWMGATRVVIHPGSLMKDTRENALTRTLKVFKEVCDEIKEDIILCPELMGKEAQVGNLEEIITLTNVDDRVIPTIDFGHLNARRLGALNSVQALLTDAIGKLEQLNGISYVTNSKSASKSSKADSIQVAVRDTVNMLGKEQADIELFKDIILLMVILFS